MGTVYSLMKEKCELHVPKHSLADFITMFSEYRDLDQNKMLLCDNSWYGKGELFDFHIRKDNDGILIDDIDLNIKWNYDKIVEQIKRAFIRYNGTLYGWTYDDSRGEFYDFFKIIAGTEIKYIYNNRPNDWLNQQITLSESEIIIDTANAKSNVSPDSYISLCCDWCYCQVNPKEIINLIGTLVHDKYGKLDFHEHRTKHRLQSHINYLLDFFPEYNYTIQWVGPISINFKFKNDTIIDNICIDFEIATLTDRSEQNVIKVLELATQILDFIRKRDGIVWGFFSSNRIKFDFFKLDKSKCYHFPFSGRPDGW